MRRGWTFAVTLVVAPAFVAGCSPLWAGPQTWVAPAESSTSPAGAARPNISAEAPMTTPAPFALELTPLPTPTALPALELPTQAAVPGGVQVWDGLPTYPADSKPDYYFRVQYDAASWALTSNLFGEPVLANRSIADCVLGPAAGRGLPLSSSVDHEVRQIGAVTYQVSSVSLGGVVRSVNYAGGDGVIFTAFEVSFTDQADVCLQAAETVLGTLRSVPTDEATPITDQ